MPARRNTEPAASESTALVMPQDVMADLLRAQAASIQTPQALPKIKIMPAGAGLYEFEDTNETTGTFTGVILGNHSRNVLWDKKFGGTRSEEPEDVLPACSANDGVYGTPREGFMHAGLGGATATGTERIECASCPYNQWGSGAALIADKNPKGKAVTNQRSVYIMLEGREVPMELVLPPTSLTGFDEYLASLLNRKVPVQAVVTEFTQERKGSGRVQYGVAHFRKVADLDQTQFEYILSKRAQFIRSITPQAPTPVTATVVEPQDDDDPPPF